MSKSCVPLKYLSAARPDITRKDADEVKHACPPQRLKWLSRSALVILSHTHKKRQTCGLKMYGFTLCQSKRALFTG